MAYVRKKNINGNEYYYLVQSIRGVQKTLKYLGKDLSEEYSGLWQKRKRNN